MRAPVQRFEVRAGGARAAYVRQVETDLRGAGVVSELVVTEVDGPESVEVTLAPPPAPPATSAPPAAPPAASGRQDA